MNIFFLCIVFPVLLYFIFYYREEVEKKRKFMIFILNKPLFFYDIKNGLKKIIIFILL